MDYKLFLEPFAMAGFQVAMTILCIVTAIILFNKTDIGAKLIDGMLKTKDHEGELKFDFAHFLLMFSLILYFIMLFSFRNAAFSPMMAEKNFIPTIDNIENYAYKIVGFFLLLVFGNKVANVWGAVKLNKSSDDDDKTPPQTPTTPQV